MKRRITGLLAAALALAMLLAACGSKPAEDNGQKTDGGGTAPSGDVDGVKDTLVVGNYSEPTVLDPPNQNIVPAALINVQIYDGLLRQNNETGEYDPCLATSWEYVDDCTIRFHLREDVTFHDGSPLTAEDVKFSFDRGAVCTQKSMVFEPFDPSKTKVIDEHTIELGTRNVFPAVEAAGSDDVYGRNPVGTGAYKFVEWIAGDRIILERNEEYWGEKPEFKNLIIRTIADDTTRAMALESGEVDVAYNLAAAQMDMLQNSSTADVIVVPSYTTQYCGLNQAYEPLSDVRVRQALRYAVDMDTISEIAFNSGRPADGPITPALSCYQEAAPELKYKQDVERAKQLMKEAGYEDGFDLVLTCNETQPRITLAEMLANAWKEIGVNTEVRVMEFSTQTAEIYEGAAQAFLLGFVAGGNEGEYYRPVFTSNGENHQWISYSNSRVDELFELAAAEIDVDKRNACYAEAQNIIREELPWLFVRFADNIYGIQKNLTGLDLDPEWYSEFRFVRSK